MNILSENISSTADLIITENIIMDMTEQNIIDLIYEENLFIKTISKACPTSFLACC